VGKGLHIEEGDIIEVQVDGDSVLLTPKRLVDKSEACFWSPGWQEAEHRASEDIGCWAPA
jgi:antitoxin component of MazEF toxin-antitoxin module